MCSMEKQLPKRLKVKIKDKALSQFSIDCYKSILAAFKKQNLHLSYYFEDNLNPITDTGSVFFPTKYSLAFFIDRIEQGEIKYEVRTTSAETFRTDNIQNIGQFVLEKLMSIIRPNVSYSALMRHDNKKSRLLSISDIEAMEILDKAIMLTYPNRKLESFNDGRFSLSNSIRICLNLEPLDNSEPVYKYTPGEGREAQKRNRTNVTIYQLEWEDLLERAKRLRCPYDADGAILRFLLHLPHYGKGAPELHGKYIDWRERYGNNRGKGKLVRNARNNPN